MGIACKQCGAQVEAERECYATPMCFACLPPPKPLPKTYTQQHVDELTRERDEALCRLDHAEADAEQAVSITISERDEARAEVERLQCAFVASVDRWMEFVSHFQRLVKSNMGPEAGKMAIGHFKRAAEAGNLDEAGPPTITPLEAAAAERAAIVAWLSAREKNLLRLREGQALFGEDLTVVDGRIYELEAAIMLITRLDHHRDGGNP